MNTDPLPHDPAHRPPAADQAPVPHYEIRVRGRLDARWAARFDGMTLAAADDGTTVICGPVVDQAALHGQLQQLRDLGIPLLSLTQLELRPATEPAALVHEPTHHHAPGAPS